GLHDLVDGIVRITGDDLAGHDVTRLEVERGGAVQRHRPHQVTLGDDAGNLVVAAHHQHRADASCAELLRDLRHRGAGSDGEYEAALLRKDIGDEHGCPLRKWHAWWNATYGAEKGCGHGALMNTEEARAALVLFSGWLDSTTGVAWAPAQFAH